LSVLAISLGNQALILYACGESDAAMALHKEAERLCRELGDKAGLSTCLSNQAHLLAFGMGQSEQALPVAEEAHRIAFDQGFSCLLAK